MFKASAANNVACDGDKYPGSGVLNTNQMKIREVM